MLFACREMLLNFVMPADNGCLIETSSGERKKLCEHRGIKPTPARAHVVISPPPDG